MQEIQFLEKHDILKTNNKMMDIEAAESNLVSITRFIFVSCTTYPAIFSNKISQIHFLVSLTHE